MKNYKNKALVCFLSIMVYFILSPCGYSDDDEKEWRKSPLEEMHQEYCTFGGILKVKEGGRVGDRWDEEFRMLEERQDRPNFVAMNDRLADLITLPRDVVKDCPSLQAYLLALVNYVNSRPNNKNITDNLRGVIGYISKVQLAEEKKLEMP